ncbi:hypothetical protein OJAV_G00234940 [Oryzias javanicus]|uniref:Uncharacterized protein n=1 Tax=Oryzias javanicus TaxID=123683 RepID=A0A3S2PMB4_ORYJA|nr:hypothetical protein OJAV_G00234940 [Oryzias javanicus]
MRVSFDQNYFLSHRPCFHFQITICGNLLQIGSLCVDMQRMQFGVIQQWDNIDARRERVPKSLIYLNEDPTLSSRNILPLPLKMTSWKALQPRSAVSEETGFKSQRMVALLLKEFKSGPTSGVSWIHIDLRTGSQFSRGSQVDF